MTKSQINSKIKTAITKLEKVQEYLDDLYSEIQQLRDTTENEETSEWCEEKLDVTEDVSNQITDLVLTLEM